MQRSDWSRWSQQNHSVPDCRFFRRTSCQFNTEAETLKTRLKLPLWWIFSLSDRTAKATLAGIQFRIQFRICRMWFSLDRAALRQTGILSRVYPASILSSGSVSAEVIPFVWKIQVNQFPPGGGCCLQAVVVRKRKEVKSGRSVRSASAGWNHFVNKWVQLQDVAEMFLLW